MDLRELYVMYDELVDAGDIDPNDLSIDDYIVDFISDLADRADALYEKER